METKIHLHADDVAEMRRERTSELVNLRHVFASVLVAYERHETNYAGHEGNPMKEYCARYGLDLVNSVLVERTGVSP